MEHGMTRKSTHDPKQPQSQPTEQKKTQAELAERELEKVSGGTCASGKHLPEVTIKP